MEFCRRKKKKEKEKEKEKEKAIKCFLKHGRKFLQELIADCNGISNPIRMFSSDQISKATNHFDPKYSFLDMSRWFTWYKGTIGDRSYLIKRFADGKEERAYNDIVLSARVSNHSGFLKLLGCCLEFPFPVLLFEDVEYGVLNRPGSFGSNYTPLLPWNVRLKIAKEVAIATTYLHTAFPRIIIHRNITPFNIFLDKNWTAKLTGLSLSVTLPEGKSWIEDEVRGTVGYIDPNYHKTCMLTPYADVYSFGILMLVLLMGTPSCLDGSDWKLIEDVKDLQESGEPAEFGGDLNDQMKMFLELALRCCEDRNEDRPTMIMVAKEIKLIQQVSLNCYSSEILENGYDDSQI